MWGQLLYPNIFLLSLKSECYKLCSFHLASLAKGNLTSQLKLLSIYNNIIIQFTGNVIRHPF